MDRRDARGAFLEQCWGCGGIFFEAAQFAVLARRAGLSTVEIRPPRPGESGLGAPPIEDASQREVFWCDLCHQPAPLAEQVIAERVTACRACARRFELEHDPEARRAAERANEEANSTRPDDSAFAIATVLRFLFP